MTNPFAIRQRWTETVSEVFLAKSPRESTLVVMVGVVILGTFIFLADFSLNNWVKFITDLVR